MSKICHEHCPGGGGGPGAVALVLIVVTAAAATPAARAVAHTVARAVELAIEVALITVGSLAAMAFLAAAVYYAARLRRSRLAHRKALPRPVVTVISARPVQAISAPRARAIEAPRRQLGDQAAEAERARIKR